MIDKTATYYQIPDYEAQTRARHYLNTRHICFAASCYPIYFYIDANKNIKGWQGHCRFGKYKDIYDSAYPIDVLIYPEQYPEYHI